MEIKNMFIIIHLVMKILEQFIFMDVLINLLIKIFEHI